MIIDPPAARRFRAALALTAILALGSGCGEREEAETFSRKTIAIDALPAPVLAAAKKQLPDVKLSEAWQNLEAGGKLHSYEIRGRSDAGKIREVRVGADGAILELE